jgi:hypothetical protein
MRLEKRMDLFFKQIFFLYLYNVYYFLSLGDKTDLIV